MSGEALFWLVCNFLTIVISAFFSMQEMAFVSFNKIRLHYYVSKKKRFALWLHALLQNPTSLFCTTLIGVNVAMFVGSECSREFYIAMGLDPNMAPFTQVFLVVIFGELAPMFAARHYPEDVAKLGIGLVYFSSKLMAPLIFLLSLIARSANMLMGSKQVESSLFLSQDELQKILEEQDEEIPHERESEDTASAVNVFCLKKRTVMEVMFPLEKVPSLPSNATCAQMMNLLKKTPFDFIALYHFSKDNVIGIVKPKDVLGLTETKRIRDYVDSPWFITEKTLLTDVLKQFKRTKEDLAAVLNTSGKAVGIITLDAILKEIFGGGEGKKPHSLGTFHQLKDKTIPADMTTGEFFSKFHIRLSDNEKDTLGDLIAENLSHPPEKGDSVSLAGADLTVKETSMMGIKTVSVSTKPE
ncbi:hemolysin family protein [Estrella lausannensis]|uniref:CNNM transmembrane domain-containing protein n=1 Tax=Estrella lausannensis TaxID=483423 RepID=A0A0H5DR73_9BACT|nr:hemolysin family protein [Estrella lausannensis]CRX38149.1 Conserved hypothetical protein [Estrella lausannensis]